MNKKQKKQLLITALVLLALIAVYAGLCMYETLGNKDGNITLCSVDPETVAAISFIASDGKERIELFRDDGGIWRCKGYEDLALSQNRIQNMCKKVATLQAKAKVSGDDAQYGLDRPSNTIRVHAAEKAYTILLGDTNSATGDSYMKLEDTDGVYSVDSTFRNLFSATVFDFAQADIVTGVSVDDVIGFSIISAKGEISFIRDTSAENAVWSVKSGENHLDRADSVAVEQALSAVLSITFDRMVYYHPSPSELDACGLSDPESSIEIRTANSEMHIFFSGEQGDSFCYACNADGSIVSTVSTALLSSIMDVSVERFRSLDIAPIKPERLHGLYISSGGKTYGYTREGDQWALNGSDITEKEFSSFYYQLYALRADKSAQGIENGISDPAAITAKYVMEDDACIVEFVPFDENYYAVRIDGTASLLINRTKVNGILALLGE